MEGLATEKGRKKKQSFIINVVSARQLRGAQCKRELECSEKSLLFGAREIGVRIPIASVAYQLCNFRQVCLTAFKVNSFFINSGLIISLIRFFK